MDDGVGVKPRLPEAPYPERVPRNNDYASIPHDVRLAGTPVLTELLSRII
jgi:hypothetical protein